MNTIRTAVAVAGAVFAGQAMAMPIEAWDSDVAVEWSGATFTAGAVNTSQDAYNIAWGVPAGPTDQSSLAITPEADGQPLTTTDLLTVGLNGVDFNDAGTIGNSVTVTHNNFPIFTSSGGLTTATARVDLMLTPAEGGDATDFSADFNIIFNETANNGGGDGLCEDGGTPPAAGCEDIFVLDASSLNASFERDGFTYFLNTFPTMGNALGTLTEGECASVGAEAGCIGFITEEATSNDVTFGYSISTRRLGDPELVPVPATLGLAALGLLGFGAARRARS